MWANPKDCKALNKFLSVLQGTEEENVVIDIEVASEPLEDEEDFEQEELCQPCWAPRRTVKWHKNMVAHKINVRSFLREASFWLFLSDYPAVLQLSVIFPLNKTRTKELVSLKSIVSWAIDILLTWERAEVFSWLTIVLAVINFAIFSFLSSFLCRIQNIDWHSRTNFHLFSWHNSYKEFVTLVRLSPCY